MNTGKVILFFTVLALSCSKKQKAPFHSDHFELAKLAKGVYGCIHKFGGKAICNVGIVDNGKETFIFDAFLSPAVANELLEAVEGLNLSPVKYVINSHSHNDHIRGNQIFGDDVTIISTKKTKELIEKWEPLSIEEEKKYALERYAYYDSLDQSFKGDKTTRAYQQILMWKPYYETLAKSHVEIQTRLPDYFVDSIEHFDGPDRRLLLITRGPGHTESDLLMFLPDDKILFSGDLIFSKCHPYMAHGEIAKWKQWLDFLKTLEITTIVPGHGTVGSGKLIDEMRDYLVFIESVARDMISNERSIQDVDVMPIPGKYKDWWFDRFYYSNLRFAYKIAQQ